MSPSSASPSNPSPGDPSRKDPSPAPANPDVEPVVADRVVAVMGTTAHLLVVVDDVAALDGDAEDRAQALLDAACDRLQQLEARWSRFRLDSELSALNRAEGLPVMVSADTMELVARCVHGWQATAGRFDPSVHTAMCRLGYDRSIERLAPPEPDAPDVPVAPVDALPRPAPGCETIEIDVAAHTIRFGPGVALDPGGIGKGLAADVVVAELLAAGAAGALINVGGDTVVAGRPPQPGGWQIGVADPHAGTDRPEALCAVVGLSVGAVATSTRLHRQWQHRDGTAHHLLDPASGAPLDNGLDAVTVMASAGWWAETLAKAAFVAGPAHAPELIRAAGATGLMVCSDGRVVPFDGLEVYLR